MMRPSLLVVSVLFALAGCSSEHDDDDDIPQADDDSGDDDAAEICTPGDRGAWDGALSLVGDINGDGIGDLLVGDPEGDVAGRLEGEVLVFHGPMITGELDLACPDAVLVGEHRGDEAGTAISGAGDVDGDGIGDLVVGATEYGTGAVSGGAFYLVRGPVVGMVGLDTALAKVVNEEDGLGYAAAIDGGGDVSGDGVPDILVGARGYREGSDSVGGAFLYSGDLQGTSEHDMAIAILVGEEDGDQAGIAVAIPGDVNSDGFADVLVGAHFNDKLSFSAGAAYLLFGPITGTVPLAQADVVLYGADGDQRVGTAVSGAGDVNGDGIADFMVGSESGGCDVVYGFLGPPTPGIGLSEASWVIRGGPDCDTNGPADFGRNPTSAGDVDGDGLDDLLLGSPYEENDYGPDGIPRAFVLFGPLDGEIMLGTSENAAQFDSPPDALRFGKVLTGGADIDDDGLDDFVVGAPEVSSSDIEWLGAVYVFTGT